MASDVQETLARAMQYAYNGDKARARTLLWDYVNEHPNHAQAWLWLAFVAESVEEKRAMLHRAIRLNPHNAKVSSAFDRLLSAQHIQQAAQRGVFVSYARADELFVAQLVDDLRSANIRVWLDIAEVPEGVDWYRAIDDALNRCGVMVAVLSPNMIWSDSNRREIERFLGAGKVVIPVMHQPCDIDALELHLPVIDCHKDYDKGAQQLMYLLSVHAAGIH